MSDSDDDDYQLPSLSDRIQSSFKHPATFKEKSDLKNAETKILKTHAKASLQVKPKHGKRKDKIDNELDLLRRTVPFSQSKLYFPSNKIAESESNESDLSNFTERVKNAPYFQFKSKSDEPLESESDSDFLNFSERIQNSLRKKNKPRPKELDETSDSESGESDFLKFSERIRNTPCSSVKPKLHVSSSSEDESEFLKFSEKISNTPRIRQKLKLNEDSSSDSDGILSDLMMKVKEVRISKLKNKCSIENCDSSAVNTPESIRSSDKDKKDIEKEFTLLFPARFNDTLYSQKRELHSKMLYKFFNEKVFSSQLPEDMPLIWDGSLLKTAGLTICTVKKGVYGCSIKLASKLLTSFDRLQDTLLHEMCHAATWMINKKNVCHGPLWQIWASRCKLILPFIECPARCHTYDIPYRFWYQCPGCGWRKGACKSNKKYEGKLCKRCKLHNVIRTVK